MNFDIYKLIACPVCKNDLKKEGERLICPVHGEYYIRKKVPVLFPESSSEVLKDGELAYADEERNRKINFIKTKLFRKPKLYIGKSLHDKLKDTYINNLSEDKLILNFGSGHEKMFMKDNMVNFDIYPHANAHIAGDGHYLPFKKESFDVVWLCAVLEHIQNPFIVMDEVHRVLKPGGYVLISVPFIQYLHASPHDYFRYTKFGLRSLCRKFKEVDSGQSYTGPAGTIVQLIASIPEHITSNKVIKNGFNFLLSWLFYPAIIFDLFIKDSDTPTVFGGVCYLGQKEKQTRNSNDR
jgi:uncharacterized protein YbaR (Trm112 family)